MKKSDIKNILIISADRWGLDAETIGESSQTPALWWTVSDSSWQSMVDGGVKEAHMPCCLLFQVGVADNQGNTCDNISIETDKNGTITKATVSYKQLVNFGGSPQFVFDMGGSFKYPYNMRDANSAAGTLTESDANDMSAFAKDVATSTSAGSFVVNGMIVDDDVDAAKIGEALNLINAGDLTGAMDMIPAQSKVLSAESSPDYDPSTVDPTSVPATPSGYQPAEMAAEDANMMNVVTEPGTQSGVQGVGSGSPTAIGEGHGVTESFGKSTAPVPGTLFSADGSIEDSYECSKCSTHFEDKDVADNCCSACYNCGYTDHVGFERGQSCCACNCDETGGGPNGTCQEAFSAETEMDSLEQATIADEMTVETIPGGSEDPLGGGPGISPTSVPAGPSDYVVEDLDARIESWMAETATHDPYTDDVPYDGPGNHSGADVTFDAERSAIGETKRPGALSRKAKRAGMTTRAFARQVKENPSRYPKLTRQQAQYYLNILEPGSKTSAKRSKVRADMRRRGYLMAESQVTWEDMQGQSSPSSPPDGIFMADQVDEIYGTGHIIGQTGSTWTTSPLAAESDSDFVNRYLGEGSPNQLNKDEMDMLIDRNGYDEMTESELAEAIRSIVDRRDGESFDVPVVGTVGTKSAVFGIGLGVGLMALLARFKK